MKIAQTRNMKAFSVASLASLCLAVALNASEVITCKSPDGKFALRHVHAEQQPYAGDTAIIEVATGKTVQPLDSNWEIGELKLLWSRDSQRVSYFADNTHFTDAGGCSTRVFFRNGSAFNEIKLPELPSPQPPSKAATESDKKTNRRVEPMDWLKTGDLVLENQMREKDVDKKNGYMSCGGDGAQASFDVALFRYRDGRPLLALCKAGEPEVEEENSVYSYLSFFELGADGKMREITRWMFQDVAEREHDAELTQGKEWEFVLPRKGKTILVRAPKTKKILHKFTWNGEKFEREKR